MIRDPHILLVYLRGQVQLVKLYQSRKTAMRGQAKWKMQSRAWHSEVFSVSQIEACLLESAPARFVQNKSARLQ